MEEAQKLKWFSCLFSHFTDQPGIADERGHIMAHERRYDIYGECGDYDPNEPSDFETEEEAEAYWQAEMARLEEKYGRN